MRIPVCFGGAAAPRLAVVEPASGTAEPCHRPQARAFSLMALILGLTYLVWLGRLVLASRGSPDIFFFVAEILSFLLLCLLSYSTWRFLSPHPGNPESKTRFSVDIFVPCCGEPVEVIQTTLKAVRRITYHPLEVYVLDDGDVPDRGGPGPIPGISLLLPATGRFAAPGFQERQPQFRVKPQLRGINPGLGRGPGAGPGHPGPAGRVFPASRRWAMSRASKTSFCRKAIPSTTAIRCFTRPSS